MLSPLKRPLFRTLWAGMTLSYAGDRLQELAQGWLVATLTGSALAVGGIGILASIPMLLMPLGGVVADQLNRRHLLMSGQGIGALVTACMAVLAFTGRIVPWHIYLWALVSGLVWAAIRPSYKVIITEAVPAAEIRPAVSLNSTTETIAIVAVNAGGSALLSWLGLPVAFLLNALSYVAAVLCLKSLRMLGRPASGAPGSLQAGRLLADLREGLVYLAKTPLLLYPLLMTFGGILLTGPVGSLLAAIVNERQGSIFQLGLLAAGGSLGSLAGALFAGFRSEGDPLRTYPIWGLFAAAAVALFIVNPLSLWGALALAALGFLAISQVVWNTSRVPRLAAPAYQARMQSITSMAFTLGSPLAAAWGGAAVDRFGLEVLVSGAALLALISLSILIHRRFQRVRIPLKPHN